MRPTVEHVPEQDAQSFTWRSFELSHFPFDWHMHPEVELTYIVNGTGQRYVGDSVSPYGPGDLVLLGPQLPHSWMSCPSELGPVHSVVLQFLPDCFGGRFFDLPEMRRVGRLLHRAAAGLVFDVATAGRVGEEMRKMEKATPARRLISMLDILQRLSGARGVQSLASSAFIAPINPGDRDRLQRLQAFLHSSLDGHIAVEDAAAAVHLSASAFSRFVRRSTGLSFVDYLHGQRVALACRQLMDSDQAITRIAYASGFGTLSNFNRIFRRLKGVTPRDFRRSYRRAG